MKIFESNPADYDLIITDMTMPGMNGAQLSMALMKTRRDIPVILCTGYSKAISEETSKQIGIKALVYKPIVKADFAKIIRNALDEKPSDIQGLFGIGCNPPDIKLINFDKIISK